jgi:hypothetical protein
VPTIPVTTPIAIISLNVDGPIVPGQAISFSFSTFGLWSYFKLGHVTASLFLTDGSNAPLFATLAPLWSLLLNENSSVPLNLDDYQSITFTLHKDQIPQSQRNDVYVINGGQSLRLVLTGDGETAKAHGAYEGPDTPLLVTYERLDNTWWDWTSLPSQPVEWKNDSYTVQGIFHNRSQYANMSSTFNLLEDPGVLTYGPQTLSVSPLTQALVDFGQKPFTKSWEWHLAFLYDIEGPRDTIYSYSPFLDMKDEFGNEYSQFRFDYGLVTVRVSDQKWAAANTASVLMGAWLAMSAIAVALSWIPVVGPSLGAGAAALLATGQGAGKVADDPPAASERYREPVELDDYEVHEPLRSSKQFPSLVSLLRLNGRIIASINALAEIRDRLLGARQAHDLSAESLQITENDKILTQLKQDSNEVDLVLELALPELTLGNLLSRELMADALLGRLQGSDTIKMRDLVSDIPAQLSEALSRRAITFGHLDLVGNLQIGSRWIRRLALITIRDNQRQK